MKKVIIIPLLCSTLFGGFVESVSNNEITNLLDGGVFGITEQFDIGSITSQLSVKCDIPNVSFEIPNVCKEISDKSFNDKFSYTLNLGGCSASLGASINEDLSDLMGSICSGNAIDEVYKTFDTYNQQQIKNVDIENELQVTPSVVKIVEADGHEVSVNEKVYPNGIKTSELFKEDGILGFTTISKGINVPKKLRTSFAKDDIITYKAYERASKVKEVDGSGSVSLDIEPYAPKTYLDYLASEDAEVIRIKTSKTTFAVLEKKFEKEVDRLKDLYNVESLVGETSDELKKDYATKYAKVLDDLMNPNIENESNDGEGEYAKAIRNAEIFETERFLEDEYEYQKKHYTIIQPSINKLKIKPKSQQIAYADAINTQMKKSVRRRVTLYFKIQKEKQGIAKLAKKVFYSKMDYNPKIAEKELEELLGEASK